LVPNVCSGLVQLGHRHLGVSLHLLHCGLLPSAYYPACRRPPGL